MKFSKKIMKSMVIMTMSAMLLVTTASASDIKVPNMGTVTVQYSSMVSAANDFDSNLGALIVDALTKNCYTVDALNNMIAAANNAITSINNIKFIDKDNVEKNSNAGVLTDSLARENGFVSQARNYLSSAQLPNAVSFGFSTAKSDGMVGVAAGTANPTSEYFDTLDFKVTTPLYSTGRTIPVVAPVAANNNSSVDLKGVSSVVDKLNKYVTLLNRVKDFDAAAGCYDNNSTNSTVAPTPIRDAVIDAKDVTIDVGTEFVIMNGVTAKDNNGTGKDLTDKITTSGEFNTAVAGQYKITYTVTGENGKAVSKTITLTVKGNNTLTDAKITGSNQVVELGTSFDKMSIIKATDYDGKDITNLVTVTGTVDTNKIGDYELVYCVVGANGTRVQKVITVTVVKSIKDAVIFAYNKTICVGDDFKEMTDVKAADNGGSGDDLTKSVSVFGSVNNKNVGKYELVYKVTGSNGVEVSKKIIITVEKCTDNTTSNTTQNTTANPNTTSSSNTTCAPVNTTCVPVNTTCAPVNTTCAPVSTPNTTCAKEPLVIQVDPIKIQVVKTDNTDQLPSNTMKATGANFVEIGLSALSMLGAAFSIIKRRR